jgi:uncharacterized protein YjbI with pentapeptide repeats
LTNDLQLQQTSIHFLEQSPKDRLLVLKKLGLARYATIFTQMPLTEANLACVMRFFQHPERVKFPDLRAVELAGLVLDGVNFIRGDLSGANLRGCRLHKADLVFARSEALVEGCQLGLGIGLTERQRRELSAGGALFEYSV